MATPEYLAGGSEPVLSDQDMPLLHRIAGGLWDLIPDGTPMSELFPEGTEPLQSDGATKLLMKIAGSVHILTEAGLGGGGGASFPTGVSLEFYGSSAPDGWVLCSGGSIGSASSGASLRANADCEALFTLLWNSMGDTEATVSGGRGADAASDWAANKTITVPDVRDRVVVGKGNMSDEESPAGRLTEAASGFSSITLGASGGSETHLLNTDEIPQHSHSVGTFAATVTADSNGDGSSTTALGDNGEGTTGDAGLGAPHRNVQPSIIANKIIKL